MNAYEDAKMRAEAMFGRELSDRELAEAMAEQYVNSQEAYEQWEEEVVQLRKELRDRATRNHTLSEQVLDKIDEILSIPHETMEITIIDDYDSYKLRYTIRGGDDIEKDDDCYPMP